MSAVPLNRKVLFRIAYFAAGLVGTFVLLEVSGVQRVNSWVILAGWLIMVSGFCIFNSRRTR